MAAVAATGTPVVLVLVSGRPLAIPRRPALAPRSCSPGCPARPGRRPSPRSSSATSARAASCRSRSRATSARCRSTTGTSRRAAARTGTATTSTARTCRCGRSGSACPTRRFELRDLRVAGATMATDGEVRRQRGRRQHRRARRRTRSSSSTCATWRRASRGRSRSCGASRASASAPGERRRVTFTLHAEQLAFTGVDGRLVIEPGRHRVMVGTSSAELPLIAEFEVTGETRRLPARSRFFTRVEVR